MSTSKHTPEPWRWELNEKSKDVQLVGGKPKFDKIVMDFTRWGMGGATPRFNSEIGSLNVMQPAKVFAEVIGGREHHAAWCKTISHPDAARIVSCVNNCAGLNPEAVPLMVKALEALTSGRHTMLASPEDCDTCAKCHHNFRDPIHFRVGESKFGDVELGKAALAAAKEGRE